MLPLSKLLHHLHVTSSIECTPLRTGLDAWLAASDVTTRTPVHYLLFCAEHTAADVSERLARVADALSRVELFYDSIGGIAGYQLKSLQLICEGMEELRSHQPGHGQVCGVHTLSPTP